MRSGRARVSDLRERPKVIKADGGQNGLDRR